MTNEINWKTECAICHKVSGHEKWCKNLDTTNTFIRKALATQRQQSEKYLHNALKEAKDELNEVCEGKLETQRQEIKEMIEGMEKKDFEVDEQVIGNEIKTDVMKLRRNIGKQSYNQALTDIIKNL